VVIDEGEKVGLAPGDHRAVQGISGPQVPGSGRLETTERLRGRPVGAGVEPQAGEMPLQRARRRSCTLAGADDLGHLGGGAPGHLTLERFGQVQ
jgi:hypothetical protein